MDKKEKYKYLTGEAREILELLISYSFIFGFNQAKYGNFKHIPNNNGEFEAWESWVENKDEVIKIMFNGK